VAKRTGDDEVGPEIVTPDLILRDWGLAGLSGRDQREAVLRLAAAGKLQRTEVIVFERAGWLPD
jgi:hypothetical protein